MPPANTEKDSDLQKSVSPVSFTEACEIVADQVATILKTLNNATEQCEIAESLGRVLSSAVLAPRDQPPFARVTRDGFAVRSQDINSAIALRVAGQVRAGEPWATGRQAMLPGEAVEIMTGAALPPGSDAVLMVEHAAPVLGTPTTPLTPMILPLAGRCLMSGENVVAQGSEARQGALLLTVGTRLQPSEIAVAASCGLKSLPVYRRFTVAILSTGDELVEPFSDVLEVQSPPARIGSHQIYDSNSHSLAALVRQANGIPLRLPAARDEKTALEASIRQGLKDSPLLLLTGGVSKGRYDLVKEVLTDLGAKFFFTGVKMQPGKPVVFGCIPASHGISQRYFFGLPGNPVSAMVTFRAFVEPLLAAMSGEENWRPRIVLATLASELRFKPGLKRFIPAFLQSKTEDVAATPIPNQGSGDLAAHARSNCYVIVPEECEHLSVGQIVRVLLQ